MIRALYLSNFKAFADTEGRPIPIRPITLIFGPNSAGKSSLIHSLLLAHEGLNTGKLDVQHTKIGGRSVDLGGFRQYVHKHQTAEPVHWGVDIEIEELEESRLKELLHGATTLKVLLHIGIRHREDKQTGVATPVGSPHVQRYELDVDGEPLLTMSWRPQGYLQLDRLNTEQAVIRRVIKSLVELTTTTEDFSQADLGAIEQAVNAFLPQAHAYPDRLLPRELEPLAGSEQRSLPFFAISRSRRQDDLADAIAFYLPRTLNDLLRGVFDIVNRELGKMSYLGPLRSYPSRHFAFSGDQDENWYAGGGHAWDIARRDPAVRRAVNRWLSSDKLVNPYELRIRRLISDRSDEVQVQMYHELEDIGQELGFDTSSGELDRQAVEHDGLPGGWDSEEYARRIGARLADRDAVEGYDELTLWDIKRETEVSHRDVGIGISQVLPVLVLAYASQNSIIAIEQPEIHVHPALQAELGDVIIESALSERSNTFILETHSEHLILRVLRRIRETTQGRYRREATGEPAPEERDVQRFQPRRLHDIAQELEADPDELVATLYDHGQENALEGRGRSMIVNDEVAYWTLVVEHSGTVDARMKLYEARERREAGIEEEPDDPPAPLPITTDDIALLYVDSSRPGSVVTQIRVDRFGQLLDPVPGGFFEEDFHELF